MRRLIGLIAIGSIRAQRMSRSTAIAQRMAPPMLDMTDQSARRDGTAAIIAWEYQIPAVVATGTATTRLQDGHVVTIDGTTGSVMEVT